MVYYPVQMDETSRQQVDLIREAFYYQSRFDGRVMVIKTDYPLIRDQHFASLMRDLALLARTGIRLVLVPGAKEWIDAVLAEYDIESSYANGLRITGADAIPFVKMAAFDVASQIVSGFAANDCEAVIGTFVRARGLGVIEGLDYQHTGTVDRIRSDTIRTVLDSGLIPVIPCIGWSASGRCYNLSSDAIALELCRTLNPAKFFVLSAHDGLKSDELILPANLTGASEGRLARLRPSEARDILSRNDSEGASDEKCRALADLSLAVRASEAGVERVQIVDGRREGAILRELFSNLGVGTMIHADEYESIRPLRTDDIAEVLRIMEDAMDKGILLRRSAEDILDKRGDYIVYEVDGSIHGSAALHDHGEGQAEIAALAADSEYAALGIGRRMVRYLLDRAREQGFSRVFVLTTRTGDWFEQQGFRAVSSESLPSKKRATYDKKRNSTVFALDL